MSELKSPLETYKDYHKEYGMLKGRQNVFEYFLNSYYKPTPKLKQRQVNSFKQLFPGRIYTFKYKPLYKDVLDYYDKRPIILAVDSFNAKTGNNITVGINLNFIPNRVRLNMLEVLFKSFKRLIDNDLRKRKNDKYNGLPSYLFSSNYDYFGIIDYIFQSIVKSGYKYAIRSYIFTRMNNVSFIEYEDWGLIPLIESSDIVGSTTSEIHSAYWKKSLKSNDKKKKK
jgi:hypothetical protein